MKTNKTDPGIWSLVFGILSIFAFSSLFSTVLGALGWTMASANLEADSSRDIARAGRLLSIIGVIIGIGLTIACFTMPNFNCGNLRRIL